MSERANETRTPGFEELRRHLGAMLEDGQRIFQAASDVLFGLQQAEAVRNDVYDTDARIDHAEQGLRREIVLQGTVHGVKSFPSLLVLMSVGKDVERIGDYAKDLFELASRGPELGDEREGMEVLRDRAFALLERARDVYRSESFEGAQAALEEAAQLQEACHAAMLEALDVAARNCAAQALACRYFERVTSHAANVVSSLVMPLDKLDFFDEP